MSPTTSSPSELGTEGHADRLTQRHDEQPVTARGIDVGDPPRPQAQPQPQPALPPTQSAETAAQLDDGVRRYSLDHQLPESAWSQTWRVELPRRSRHSRSWWRVRLLALAVMLLVDAVIVVVVLAATYQPLAPAGAATSSFAGMPTARGAQMVNDLDGLAGQLYVPPQLGAFTLTTSVVNNGPEAVVVQAVELDGPGSSVRWPLVAAGAARVKPFGAPAYWPPEALPRGGVVIPAHSALDFALPVRFADSCFARATWSGIDELWFEERWAGFHHWVAIGVPPVLFDDPEPAPLIPPSVPRDRLLCLRGVRN